MISESKLDDIFPHGQFLIDGFRTFFRFDRNKIGGGIVLYIREHITAKILSHDFPSAESFFVERISKALDVFSTIYENIILLGDFNVCDDDETMRNFCNSYRSSSLINAWFSPWR